MGGTVACEAAVPKLTLMLVQYHTDTNLYMGCLLYTSDAADE